MSSRSDAAAPAGAASDNPPSRKLPEPIEAAIANVVAQAALAADRNATPVVAAVDRLRQAIRPMLPPGSEEVLQQLRAARQWFTFLVDELDLEPEATAFIVSASSPSNPDGGVLARVTLGEALAQMDLALKGAAA